jgi:hypothetical protein
LGQTGGLGVENASIVKAMVVPFGSTAIAPTAIRRSLDEQDASYIKSYKQNAPKTIHWVSNRYYLKETILMEETP